MWLHDPQVFAKKYKITTKQVQLFKCTAEHLKAKQEGGKDSESNIVAACHYCNQKRHKYKSPKEPISYKQYVTNRLEKGKWNLCMMHKHSTHSRKMSDRQNVLVPTGMHTPVSTPDRV